MDRAQAKTLIHKTFTQPFQRENFQEFISNLLKHISEPSTGRVTQQYILKAFKSGINHYERLATYTDPNGEKVDVVIVHLKGESRLERARTFQRNFVAAYLVQRQKQAALVAFVSPDEEDWRFSLVKMEYVAKESDTGVKVEAKLTPAKRHSFLVGKNENSHTAQAQLIGVLADDEHDPTLAQLEEAFSVERVTKEFFEQYKALFLDVEDELEGVLKRDARVREDFKSKDISPVDFAKKLLGQIVFLYFLQKKGWFGVDRDAEWGTGPKNYLRRLFEERKEIGARSRRSKSGVNFFDDVLEPLFYEALARERPNNFYSLFQCKIPFLNGGLFDPIGGYDWVQTDILLPDTLFSNDEGTKAGDKGTGILDVFDRYNFTVNEAEPLEKEVAVDPEMLGKVFENLLEVKERKSKGSFYTPREIVHYMCQQSLINYLCTELAECAVPREDIETFIRIGERAVDFEMARIEGTKSYADRPTRLPKTIEQNAAVIDQKLIEITVCDPAIGSGAFPVGMMNEIVRARKTLTPYFADKKSRTVYEFKRHAIQNCLYGVDIDPGAVEIAKLRLWLSLVVDEDDIKQIKPLPNLDYKIMQGNSLLEEFEGVKLFDDRLLKSSASALESEREAIEKRRKELQDEFFSLHQREKLTATRDKEIKDELARMAKRLAGIKKQSEERPQQYALTDDLGAARKKVDELNYLHREFFDVQAGKKKDELRQRVDTLEWEFMEATLKEQGNEKALFHLKKLRHASAKPFFLWKLHFMEVFRDKGGFDVVIGNPPYSSKQSIETKRYRAFFECVEYKCDPYAFFIEFAWRSVRRQGAVAFIVPVTWMTNVYYEKLRRRLIDSKSLLRVNLVEGLAFESANVDTSLLFLLKDGVESETFEWAVTDPSISSLELTLRTYASVKRESRCDIVPMVNSAWSGVRNKLESNTRRLGTFSKISLGMKLAGNDRFVVEARDKKHPDPIIFGKDVSLYGEIEPTRFFSFATAEIIGGTKNPAVHKTKNKIFVQAIRNLSLKRRIVATLDTEGLCFIGTVNSIIPNEIGWDPFYLLGLVNSTLLNAYFCHRFTTISLTAAFLGELPIKPQSSDTKRVSRISELVNQRLRNKTADTRGLEREIDEQVYVLYGLTSEEIKIVEESVKR